MTKREIFNIINSAGENAKDNIGTAITVIFATITKKTDGRPVAHFITNEKKHFASLANSVVEGVANMISTGFIPSEAEPVEIVFTENEYEDGTYISFEMV